MARWEPGREDATNGAKGIAASLRSDRMLRTDATNRASGLTNGTRTLRTELFPAQAPPGPSDQSEGPGHHRELCSRRPGGGGSRTKQTWSDVTWLDQLSFTKKSV